MATDAEAIQINRPTDSRLFSVLVIDERDRVANAVARRIELRNVSCNDSDSLASPMKVFSANGIDGDEIAECEVVVFSPLRARRGRLMVDLDYARSVFNACRNGNVRHFVLISSAEIYGSDYHSPGMVSEARTIALKHPNGIAASWLAVESLANEHFASRQCRLSILRPCPILTGDQREFASRLFGSRLAFPLAGYDPSIQLLSVDDYASAVAAVVAAAKADIYNVAPRQVIPLRKAMRLAGILSFPIPYSIQRAVRAVFAPLGMAERTDQIEFLRYPWTVSNQKLKDECKFAPQKSSADAVVQFRSVQDTFATRMATWNGNGGPPIPKIMADSKASVDDFGMDEQYIRSCGRWQLGFMEKVYWRIEVDGLEHIPVHGGAVLAGIHRGFMPFDGVMLVHLMSKYLGRVPRFLMHPGLVKFPHLSRFLTRLGGIIACQENADQILRNDGILGVFPEGIRGAFRMYDRDIYKIGKQRDDYVKAALRHRVPIVPFVTVGAAETFPIVGKIDWSFWKRYTHWPFFPVTPTGNLVPLPSKWTIRILDAIATGGYDADAANDKKIVRALSHRVQVEMQSAIDDMLSRRRSIFFGSLRANDKTDTNSPRNTPHVRASTASVLETP